MCDRNSEDSKETRPYYEFNDIVECMYEIYDESLKEAYKDEKYSDDD